MKALRRFGGLALTATLALGWGGCSKDKEVESVLGDLDSFTTALVGKVRSAATPQVGIDEAQKYLAANGGALRAKLAGIKTVRGFQISADTRKKLEASFTSNATAVAGLQLEYAMQAAMDRPFRERLEKLVSDYKDLLVG